MLHELLVTLSGYSDAFESNQFIIESVNKCQNEEDPQFEGIVNKMVKCVLGNSSLFHVCERSIVKDLLKISLLNKRLLLFNDNCGLYGYQNNVAINTSKICISKGHYLSAFASAIYDESKSYQIKIVELEEKILKDPTLSLSSILLELQPFEPLLLEVCNLINTIEKEKIYGCKTLELVHQRLITTVGANHNVLNRIEKKLSKVFLEHLSHWLLYGELLDTKNEFFICFQEPQNDSQPHPKMPPTGAEYEELCQQIKDMELDKDEHKETIMEAVLNVDMIPDFIDITCAENILFIGESIQFYEREDRNNDATMTSQSGLVLKEKEKEFMTEFRKLLQQDKFNVIELLELIECIRLCVSESLYSLVTDAGLVNELSDVKAVFLLGRGELYQALFTLTKDYTTSSPFLADINFDGLFKKAGHQVLLDDRLLDKFTLSYKAQQENQGSLWKNIYIAYNVKKPFHQILNKKLQEDYNVILRFLLHIRLAQFRLQQLWINMKDSQQTRSDSQLELTCWAIRHEMSSLIYNIQYYIKVDVLESQFNVLLEDIVCHRDYQRMEKAHKLFLSSVASGCFLSHPLLSASIENIVSKVHSFCDLFSSAWPSEQALKPIREDFEMVTVKFYWALSVLGQQRSSQFISQLVTRIDYNRFYTHKSTSNDIYSSLLL